MKFTCLNWTRLKLILNLDKLRLVVKNVEKTGVKQLGRLVNMKFKDANEMVHVHNILVVKTLRRKQLRVINMLHATTVFHSVVSQY